MVQIYWMKITEQFLSFKLHGILSSVMKFHTILLCFTQDMNHPFVQWIHAVYTTPAIGYFVAM
jgi:hypothetical protein